MATGVRDLETEILRGLLTCLHLQSDALSGGVQLAEGALVDRKRRIDEIAAILREPARAVQRAGGLLAASES